MDLDEVSHRFGPVSASARRFFPSTKVSFEVCQEDGASHSLGSRWCDWEEKMPPNHTGSRRLSLCELKLFSKAQLTDWFLWLRQARVRAGACVCLRAACIGVGFFFNVS